MRIRIEQFQQEKDRLQRKQKSMGRLTMSNFWRQISPSPYEFRPDVVAGVSRVLTRSTLAVLVPLLIPCIWYAQRRARNASLSANKEPGLVSDTIGVGTFCRGGCR